MAEGTMFLEGVDIDIRFGKPLDTADYLSDDIVAMLGKGPVQEDFDEDPLDLLEDDGDGVIETILMEEEEKPVLQRTGCSVLLLGVSSSVGVGWWVINNYFA